MKDMANITKQGMANNSKIKKSHIYCGQQKNEGKKGRTEKVDKTERKQQYMYLIGLNQLCWPWFLRGR